MKYTSDVIKQILLEFKSGKNKSKIAMEYGIPRSTLRYWIDNENTISVQKISDKDISLIIKEIENNKEIYNYILGLYLGDGCISLNKMSYKLRITQDEKYPISIVDIKNKMDLFFNKNANVCNGDGKCKILTIYDKNLPLYFPQHGAGKKHDREIILSDYQRDNIDFLYLMKGLWMSDGSYYIASRNYEAYNFTNKSTDIISLFEECLTFCEVNYRKRIKKNGVWIIEITKKSEVQKMKELVGFKS